MSFGKAKRLGGIPGMLTSPKRRAVWVALSAGLLAALPAARLASAQYVGKVGSTDKTVPELRSVAVLEWTGDPGKPKASRLVPISVLDGGQLQDGGIYLARPQPLAVGYEVEYELQQDGKPLGLFDIQNAGQQFGSWVGFGAWKPIPSAHPKLSAAQLAKVDLDGDYQSDEPVLHRKHHAEDAPASGSGSGSDSSAPDAPSDPDRPVLHKAPSAQSSGTSPSGDTSSNNGSSAGSSGSGSGNGPVLHKKDDSGSSNTSTDSGTSSASNDPDRPVLHKPKAAAPSHDDDDDRTASSDPDRPRLKRGKANADKVAIAPTLLGLPPDLEQTVAVSDAQTHPPHPWDFSWASPDDEAKMKESMEDLARTALGINAPPAPKPVPKRTATSKKAAKPDPAPPPPATLADEKFRVFELAYGSGATLVLSAHTDGPPAQQKFVTLIAQPDLYGNVLLLKKSVTDAAHLDENPRMRLIDAVDAMADNRGELLFELRGSTQRQFALYRVLRGQAEQLFVTGGGQFAAEASE